LQPLVIIGRPGNISSFRQAAFRHMASTLSRFTETDLPVKTKYWIKSLSDRTE